MANKKIETSVRGIIKEILTDVLATNNKLVIFDFDDTLVKTDSQVVVVHEDGTRESLTPEQYANYKKEKQPGDTLDYSAFRSLVNPRIIKHVARHLQKSYESYGPECILVLTARGGDVSYIQDYLTKAGFPGIQVVGLGCDSRSIAAEKASYVVDRIKRDGLTYVEFLDDCEENVKAIKNLENSFPNVQFVTRTIK